MKKLFKTFFAPMVAAFIIAGSVFFVAPATANAGASSCLIGLIKSKAFGTTKVTAAAAKGTAQVTAASISGGVAGAMSVPVYDSSVVDMVKASNSAVADLVKANATINSDTAAQTNGLSIQRCIVEPLVTTLARTLLNKFTAQTVNWINSGFKGSPLYVTNLQGFMTDVADQTFGNFIEGLGPIGQFLCSPFDLQLRLSLGIEYGMSGYEEEIGCRLTDIQNNVNRAFTSGVFGKNGWDNWLQITATPQNNPYGAYIKAVDALDIRLAGAQTIQLTQLGWGSGFLSSVNPETGEVETPGKLIENQLSETLAQPIRNIGLAKDIDAILNALVGQMINQVLGPGGLLGAGSTKSGNASSVLNSGLSPTAAADTLNQNETSQTLPDGVLSAGQTPTQFCYDYFSISWFFRDTSVTPNTIWFQKGIRGANGTTITHSPTQQQAFKQPTGATTPIPWTVTDYNNIVNFCNNVDYTVPVGDGADKFINEQTGGGDTGEATTTVTIQETPQNKLISVLGVTANQSYAQPDGYGNIRTAQNALNGRLASTYKQPNSWMTFTFPNNQTFGTIEISGYTYHGAALEGGTVAIFNGDADPSPFIHTITATEATDKNGSLNTGSTISITVPSKNGNIVKINTKSYIIINGIKFFQPDTSASSSGLPIAFSPSTIPLNGSVATRVPGVVNTQSIIVASNQNSGFSSTISFSLFKAANGNSSTYEKVNDISTFLSDNGFKFKFCPYQGTLNCDNSTNDFTAVAINHSDSFSHNISNIPQSNNSKIRYQFTLRGTVAKGDYKLVATMPTYTTGTLAEIYITVQ